jgi:hypothetical protein
MEALPVRHSLRVKIVQGVVLRALLGLEENLKGILQIQLDNRTIRILT